MNTCFVNELHVFVGKNQNCKPIAEYWVEQAVLYVINCPPNRTAEFAACYKGCLICRT